MTSRAAGPPPTRCRARDLGIRIGHFPTGPTNSLVDVPGVRVGHATVWRDEPAPPTGRGVARTGVTAIVPFGPGELFANRVPAGAAVLNGAGEAIGITTIREWGLLESPIFLTSSMAIGRVYDAAVATLVELEPRMGRDDAFMPVVAECDDSILNETRIVQVDATDVRVALETARGPEAGPMATGAIGAGTGMSSFELKAGIGSASRRVRPVDRRFADLVARDDNQAVGSDAGAYTVGVLALANFGLLEWLTVDGVPLGRELHAVGWPQAGLAAAGLDVPDSGRYHHRHPRAGPRRIPDAGSCIVVVATDAPLLSGSLNRLARRAGLGLARAGSFAGHGSGEIFLGCSTGLRVPRGSPLAHLEFRVVNEEYLGPFFAAVVEATEEAILDALVGADTVVGRDGSAVPGLPLAETVAILRRYGHAEAALPAGFGAAATGGGTLRAVP